MAESEIAKALVIGDGSWGTTLAILLARRGIATTLWSVFPEHAEEMAQVRANQRFLPGVEFPGGLTVSADPFAAADGAQLAISAVPTQFLRLVAMRFEDALPGTLPLVTASKGLEIETFRSPSQILREVLGERAICVLTGPSHAEEVARGLPASVVAASTDAEFAATVQAAFSGDSFRVYTHTDPVGAELAAALKNVIAIAAGICDGLELGDNAKSALLTRGIVEMARFGPAHGPDAEPFIGQAGVGEQITTSTTPHSRNRGVGEAVGRGQSLQEVLSEMSMVAEGVWTTKALFGPETDLDQVSMPIAQQVHDVLFNGKNPLDAVLDLMRREVAGEMEGLFG